MRLINAEEVIVSIFVEIQVVFLDELGTLCDKSSDFKTILGEVVRLGRIPVELLSCRLLYLFRSILECEWKFDQVYGHENDERNGDKSATIGRVHIRSFVTDADLVTKKVKAGDVLKIFPRSVLHVFFCN